LLFGNGFLYCIETRLIKAEYTIDPSNAHKILVGKIEVKCGCENNIKLNI